ncbi:MAG: chloride channel protein [Janthinobacterium lividum]
MRPIPRPALPSKLRRTRLLWLARRQFQRRALFVLGGVAVGAAAIGLALAADWASGVFDGLYARWPLAVLLLTPAGFALSNWLARRYFPNSGGSGIPQVIAARALDSRAARERLVSLKMAAGKSALLVLGLLCGGSIGREGPTVQVGASIMFAVGRLTLRRQPGLLLAGAGAGVAAAFNTPLAGIVFGIEEMSRSFETRTTGVVLGTIIAAGLTSLFLRGDYTYFGVTQVELGGAAGWIALPVLAAAAGLLGGGFGRGLVLAAGPNGLGRMIRSRPVLFAAGCGLVVAACGLLSDGGTFGTGYAQARALVQHEAGVPVAAFGVLKFVASLASAVAGIPGGIFAPSLSVGAGLGANAAALLPGVPAAALVVIGMVAYFSGVVQAPLTAFVIVNEMTGDHAMIVPLMLASLIGYGASKLVCKEGVYHALSHNFIAAGRPPG